MVNFIVFATMKEYQSYSNKILSELLSKDDQVAFNELYNRFWKCLFVIAYNRLKDTTSAEDIVHDVFASLWANRQKTEITNVENYLATATKYLVLTKIKKNERERLYKQQRQAPVFEIPLEASLHYKLILEIVKTEIEKLPEKCRLIFKYSRMEGMPVRQIAKELSISPKTVENQISKAIKQLKLATKSYLNSLLLQVLMLFFIA